MPMETPHWFRTNHGWGSSRLFQIAVRWSPRWDPNSKFAPMFQGSRISQHIPTNFPVSFRKKKKHLKIFIYKINMKIYQVNIHLKHGSTVGHHHGFSSTKNLSVQRALSSASSSSRTSQLWAMKPGPNMSGTIWLVVNDHYRWLIMVNNG